MHLPSFRPSSPPDFGSAGARSEAQAARTDVELLRGEIERWGVLVYERT